MQHAAALALVAAAAAVTWFWYLPNHRGELRAVGNVLRDQLFYMHRCGFDAFELQPGKSIEEALGAFDELSVRYQAAVDEPEPLFRRR